MRLVGTPLKVSDEGQSERSGGMTNFSTGYRFRILRLQTSQTQPKQAPVAKPSKVSGDNAPVRALLRTESTNKARNTSTRTAAIRISICMCAPIYRQRVAAQGVSDARYDSVTTFLEISGRSA
jgi:hypothetical protein